MPLMKENVKLDIIETLNSTLTSVKSVNYFDKYFIRLITEELSTAGQILGQGELTQVPTS